VTTGNVQVNWGYGGGYGGGAQRTVTLVLPLAVAKDLLFALNLALGGGGGKKPKY
jgi:hypothetical protein